MERVVSYMFSILFQREEHVPYREKLVTLIVGAVCSTVLIVAAVAVI